MSSYIWNNNGVSVAPGDGYTANPVGPAGGNLTGTYPNPQVVRINDATVPLAGSLTAGHTLQVSGLSELSYDAINLAGGDNYVSGILPKLNQDFQDLDGDLTGSTDAAQVIQINGASVPAAGSLITGHTLQVSNSSSLIYSSLNLAGGSNFVTGQLPTINQVVQILGNNLSGTTSNAVTIKVNGASVPAAGLLTAGNMIQVSGPNELIYGPLNLNGGDGYILGKLPVANQIAQNLSNDLSGTTDNASVIKLNGASIPASGSLITGNILQVSSSSGLTYTALNLAGGANYITGLLPTANQVVQSLSGDLSGTTASSIVNKINGATVPIAGTLTSGHVLKCSGTSALGYGFILNANIDGYAAISGTKIIPDFGSQSIITTGTATINGVSLTGSITPTSLVNNSAIVKIGELIRVAKTISLIQSVVGNYDYSIWVCPAGFRLIDVIVKVISNITIAALSISTIKIGVSVGGSEVLGSYGLAGTETTASNPIGNLLSQLGSDLNSFNGYQPCYLSAKTFTLRHILTSGSVTAGSIQVQLIGYQI